MSTRGLPPRVRFCARCENEADVTIIHNARQVDVCEDHLDEQVRAGLGQPKLIDLHDGHEMPVKVDWVLT